MCRLVEVEPSQDLVRIGAVARELGVSPSRVRQLADEGSIPSTRTSGGHRLFDVARVREALARRALPAPGRRPPPDLLQEHVPAGLEEHVLWREAAERLHLDDRVSADCRGAAQYAFSEMVNNAVDHAQATLVTARWWLDMATLSFEVDDDWRGVFT